MSSRPEPSRTAVAGNVVNLYSASAGLALFGIIVLLAYVVHLGAIIGPGVEESFGLAVGTMFLFGALLVHLVDRAYREWPLGRRIDAAARPALDDAAIATFLKALVVAAMVGAVVYIFWGLLAS